MKTLFFLIAFFFVATMTQAFAEGQAPLNETAVTALSADHVSASGPIQLPEPATLILLGSGLISLATGMRSKLK